jgi:hypothetical protein
LRRRPIGTRLRRQRLQWPIVPTVVSSQAQTRLGTLQRFSAAISADRPKTLCEFQR